ncbi:MAG: homoserine O-succinyltransferase [Rhodospirillales bacterium]|nr:homoserine O-succinyltransferase [Rhodospirillales bacterium]
MPLVANSTLPTYERLREEGRTVLDPQRALHQDIRELHIGFLNMMPDAALEATERQFYRRIGESNQIAQFHMHPFTLPELPRSAKAQNHIDRYYEPFEKLAEEGLDALIITGANVKGANLWAEPFWEPLQKILDWSWDNVTSTLCSCLATHAVMEQRHGQKRRPLPEKRWGVYTHRVTDRTHPLVRATNTIFDVPHSRWNEIGRDQFETAGMHVLVESEEAGVHLAVSADGFRLVCMQGHPEYDIESLLKEYKREVGLFQNGQRADYPPFPLRYMSDKAKAVLDEYADRAARGEPLGFPEEIITPLLDNTWRDTARNMIGNWIGMVYQVTNADRQWPFMESVNPDDPLGWHKHRAQTDKAA